MHPSAGPGDLPSIWFGVIPQTIVGINAENAEFAVPGFQARRRTLRRGRGLAGPRSRALCRAPPAGFGGSEIGRHLPGGQGKPLCGQCNAIESSPFSRCQVAPAALPPEGSKNKQRDRMRDDRAARWRGTHP